MAIALRVTRRPGASEPDAAALPLPTEGLTIGRADDCGLVLADPLRLVSRQHAQVFVAGDAARVRCLSTSTPLWLNDTQLEPGTDDDLRVGDRLRIGRFEIAVEPQTVMAAPRSRLDRWFDLDSAPDVLAPESPLPALVEAPEVATSSAVVSWRTSRHVVRTGVPTPVASSPPAPVNASADTPAASVAPAAAPATPAKKAARRTIDGSTDVRELAAAFGRGAGLRADTLSITPESMEHIGALLRATAQGTLALLQSRAMAKRHMRAEGTHIAPRQNNPLKFSPDATEALTRMLQRDPSPGFLDPVAALNDAHRDLLVHQVAMVAGMRAAVFELFSRLGPQAAENAEGPAHGLSRVSMLRAAALWQRHCTQHAQLLENLDDDFEAIFGREFLRAYEAQSRATADPDPDAGQASAEAP